MTMGAAGSDYDRMGEAYAAQTEHSPWNALYDRPAILALAGDVRGQLVLDVGCAAGALSAALVESGARVVGIDASPFYVDELVEPMPLPECDEHFPEDYASLTTKPRFLYFRLLPRIGPPG